MTHIEMAKAALEACDHTPVSLQSQMAQVAIAHALVALVEMEQEIHQPTIQGRKTYIKVLDELAAYLEVENEGLA